MGNLINVQDFEEFVYNTSINEKLFTDDQNTCDDVFLKYTDVPGQNIIIFEDGSSVTPKEIIDAVNQGLYFLNSQYRRTFAFGNNTLNLIYLAHSEDCNTMAVDGDMNLYVNAGFVFHQLKMDKELIAAVIMHEVLHALYDHINRGKNWLAAQGKSRTPENWHDTNLAADVEVNRTLTKIRLISEERLVNEINGLYLKTKNGSNEVIPMETILNNEEYMKILRDMCPPKVNPEKLSEINTSKDWDEGYVDGWNKIAELVEKHGYEKVWEILKKEGIVDEMGMINGDVDIKDIKALNFLQIKSFEDYINESNEKTEPDSNNAFSTYEGGFKAGLSQIVGAIASAIKGGSDSGLQPLMSPMPPINTKIDNKDLKQVKLPLPKNNNQNKNGGNNLPQNIKNDQSNDSNKKDKNGEDNDNGGSNQMENDLNQKTEGGKKKVSIKQDVDFQDSDSNSSSDQNGKQTQKPSDKKGQDGNQGKSDNDQEYGPDGESGGQETGQGQGGVKRNLGAGNDKKNTGIGGFGSFNEEGLSNDALRRAGYSDEDIEAINKVRESNKISNSTSRLEKFRAEAKNDHVIKKFLDAIEVESEKYKNVWKKILDKFLSKRTRRAGVGTRTGSNDWMNKKWIARGEYFVNRKQEKQDPQDVNVYVDVSGSMNIQLLEIIAKSLVIFTQEYEYSGLCICPWASTGVGAFMLNDFSERSEEEVTRDIIKIIEHGSDKGGGGTESRALISSMVGAIDVEEKEDKDDVHVVITDGWFDYENIENRMRNAVKQTTKRYDAADTMPEHTFWMIYDADENLREKWKAEIKEGVLIFINTEVVINNR